MPGKPKEDKAFDSEVAKNSEEVWESPVYANGDRVLLKFFGASCPNEDTFAVLEWGSGSSWELVRAVVNGTIDMRLWKTFAGDGSKRFRLTRRNENLSQDKIIIAWTEITVG